MRRLGRLGPRGAAPAKPPATGSAFIPSGAPPRARMEQPETAAASFTSQPRQTEESSHS